MEDIKITIFKNTSLILFKISHSITIITEILLKLFLLSRTAWCSSDLFLALHGAIVIYFSQCMVQ